MSPAAIPAETIDVQPHAEAARAIAVMFRPGDVVEVRVPKAGRNRTMSGYFNDPTALVKAVRKMDGKGPGVYLTLNPVKPDLLARANNRVKPFAETTTSDADILERRWMLVDCDPVRPAGISSSSPELEAALDVAEKVREHLRGRQWPEPVFCLSGNGFHLLYRLPDLANSDASTILISRALKALSAKFSSATVHIDETVFNAARISKAYGTFARKGDHTPERPYRLSRMVDVPDAVAPVSVELLKELAAEAPEAQRASANEAATKTCEFDVEAWMAKVGISVEKGPSSYRGGRRWTLAACPFDSRHTGGSAAVFESGGGVLGFKCQHSACRGKGWKDVRRHLDPEYVAQEQRQAERKREERDRRRQRRLARAPDAEELVGQAQGDAIHLTDLGNARRLLAPALPRLAGAARRTGSSVEAINAYPQPENRDRCKPALPVDEVRQIAESVSKYPPAEKQPSGSSGGSVSTVNLIETPLTDAGNAERLYALYGERFRYSHPQRTFFVWDNTRWVKNEHGEMRHLARETARQLYSQAWDVRDAGLRYEIIRHALRSESSQAITNMLREVASIPGVAVVPDELDRAAFLLNVRNGTVDLQTGELRPHRRQDLLTKIAPVEYDAAAKCPRWLQFLAEVFAPHPDIPDFIQRAVGYSLTADTREECLFLCYGTGRNGKGTFLKTVCDLLGDYASTADFSAFVVRKNDGPRDDIANMRGRRLVRAEESNEGGRLAEGIVKTLTGGDRVRARRLHENSYEFDPTWKIWLATNHKPAIRGTDPAIWSRLKLIPFEISFAGREDRGLKQRLRNEMPGILAWAVEGCLRWQAEGLEFPNSVLNATAEYREEADHVGHFIAEECVTLPNYQSPARALYSAYRRWAEGAGEGELTETEFGRRMTDRGYQRKRMTRGNVYMGLMLRSDSEASV